MNGPCVLTRNCSCYVWKGVHVEFNRKSGQWVRSAEPSPDCGLSAWTLGSPTPFTPFAVEIVLLTLLGSFMFVHGTAIIICSVWITWLLFHDNIPCTQKTWHDRKKGRHSQKLVLKAQGIVFGWIFSYMSTCLHQSEAVQSIHKFITPAVCEV